jgi:hypothetical protein
LKAAALNYANGKRFLNENTICHQKRKKKMNPEQLEAEIMKLNLEARASLAERIILSLDAPTEAENLQLWVREAERRLKDLREGKAKEEAVYEVLQRARAAILCGK